jgi:hypothetical protein
LIYFRTCLTILLNKNQFKKKVYLKKDCNDEYVQKACQNLSKLKESLSELNPNCRLEATLGFEFHLTKKWFNQMNIPIPKNLLEFKEKKGPTGKTMPSTGIFSKKKVFFLN